MFRPRPRKKRDLRRHPLVSFQDMWPPFQGPWRKGQKPPCRCGCGEPLQARERSWRKGHDAPCLEAYRIAKGCSQTIRAALSQRDSGICAECTLATDAAVKLCGRWMHQSDFAVLADFEKARAELEAVRAKFMALGFPPPCGRGSWWEADHIQPVEEGGANSLENLRTLCIRCHKRVTREHAARRASRRRGVTFPCLI